MEQSGELTAHFTSGAMAVYAIEWLKGKSWCPWITADTKTLNRFISGAAAALAVMGISWSYDPSVGGTITLPALSLLLTGVWEWLKQFSLQQVLFDAVVQKAGKDASKP
jgi:hypothetical protein